MASWVKYKSVEMDTALERTIIKQAYTLEEIDPPRLSAKSRASVKVVLILGCLFDQCIHLHFRFRSKPF